MSSFKSSERCVFQICLKICSWKSKIKHVVKYDVGYIADWVHLCNKIYVVERKHISGQKEFFRAPPSRPFPRDPGSCIQDPGSWILDPRSWTPGSQILWKVAINNSTHQGIVKPTIKVIARFTNLDVDPQDSLDSLSCRRHIFMLTPTSTPGCPYTCTSFVCQRSWTYVQMHKLVLLFDPAADVSSLNGSQQTYLDAHT